MRDLCMQSCMKRDEMCFLVANMSAGAYSQLTPSNVVVGGDG